MYVLLNPSMPGLVKVGLTTRDAAERARELAGASGVPTDFIVAYEANFEDVHGAEQHMHAALSDYRVSRGREFFRIPPTFAIDTLLELRLQGLYGATTFLTDPIKRDARERVKFQGQHRARELYEQGQAHELGRGVPKSRYEALKYYEAAAKAGLPEAHARLGASLLRGYGTAVDVNKGLKTLEKGAALGDLDCLRELGVAHQKLGQPDVALDRWREYFDAAPGTDEAAYHAARFLLTLPRHYRLSGFFNARVVPVLRMVDLIVFAQWHAQVEERRAHHPGAHLDLSSPLEALSGLDYDTRRPALALLEEVEAATRVNSSVVLHVTREQHLRDLAWSAGQQQREAPSWSTWEDFDQVTGTSTPRPERVPPQLNDPYGLAREAATPERQRQFAFWHRRFTGEGMKLQRPRPRRRR
nr:GIY-YIG nuclease family protein [Deinococcus aestuarii]